MAERAFESFSGEMIAMLREALDIAVEQIAEQNRTPATRAAMAQTIVRGAANGILDAGDLVSMAVKTGAKPAP
jgi:hypothetical protein